jgi:predicted transcriptional regulator
MKRTTLYLDPELEVLLKLEMLRQNRPMAEIVREAVAQYVAREPAAGPPGAGQFASGRKDTADDVEAALDSLGFGDQAERAPIGSGKSRRRRDGRRTRR